MAKKIPPPREGGSGRASEKPPRKESGIEKEVRDSGGDPSQAYCTTCSAWYSLEDGGHDH